MLFESNKMKLDNDKIQELSLKYKLAMNHNILYASAINRRKLISIKIQYTLSCASRFTIEIISDYSNSNTR